MTIAPAFYIDISPSEVFSRISRGEPIATLTTLRAGCAQEIHAKTLATCVNAVEMQAYWQRLALEVTGDYIAFRITEGIAARALHAKLSAHYPCITIARAAEATDFDVVVFLAEYADQCTHVLATVQFVEKLCDLLLVPLRVEPYALGAQLDIELREHSCFFEKSNLEPAQFALRGFKPNFPGNWDLLSAQQA